MAAHEQLVEYASKQIDEGRSVVLYLQGLEHIAYVYIKKEGSVLTCQKAGSGEVLFVDSSRLYAVKVIMSDQEPGSDEKPSA